jgi:hypothetical protein
VGQPLALPAGRASFNGRNPLGVLGGTELNSGVLRTQGTQGTHAGRFAICWMSACLAQCRLRRPVSGSPDGRCLPSTAVPPSVPRRLCGLRERSSRKAKTATAHRDRPLSDPKTGARRGTVDAPASRARNETASERIAQQIRSRMYPFGQLLSQREQYAHTCALANCPHSARLRHVTERNDILQKALAQEKLSPVPERPLNLW